MVPHLSHLIFPEKDKQRQDVIVIIGLEENVIKARDDILRRVQEMEDMYTEEVRIDHRVHSRLIGSKGRAISKVMDDFKVDIRMPGRDADDVDLVVISGREDDVLDCRDHLLNLEEEYLQDVMERQEDSQYLSTPPGAELRAPQSKPGAVVQPSRGFVVRDAPWSTTYTHNADDFPNLATGASNPGNSAPRPVWPIIKR